MVIDHLLSAIEDLHQEERKNGRWEGGQAHPIIWFVTLPTLEYLTRQPTVGTHTYIYNILFINDIIYMYV